MGKLSDFVSKGVRLIVEDPENPGATERPTADEPAPRSSSPRPPAPRPAPPREITPQELASPPPPVRSDVAMEVEDFGAVYTEAGVTLPDHGYGVDKVGEMLQGKRLSSLARDVRATAVLGARVGGPVVV
jgi:hypothetical protein